MKGIMFSFILIVTVFSLITFISIQKGLVISNSETQAVSTRINSMLNFYNSVLSDGGKATEIITRRAMAASVNYVINGSTITQADQTIEELIVNGTINNTLQGIMINSKMDDWKNKMVSIGTNESFDVKINLTNIQVKPYDSWNLIVSMDVSVNISDIKGLANLTKLSSISQQVSIEGIEDTIYALNTAGIASNIIVKSPYINNYTSNLISATGGNSWFRGTSVIYPSSQSGAIDAVTNKAQKILVTDNVVGIEGTVNQFGGVISETDIVAGISIPFVDNAASAMSNLPDNTKLLVDGANGKVWYMENIVTSANTSQYFPSLTGGSFLDRLEGKLTVQAKYSSQTPNIIGIESFVNKNILSSLGILVSAKSNIDHIYFSSANYPTYTVKGMDSTFLIDKELDLNNNPHDVIYGLSQLE